MDLIETKEGLLIPNTPDQKPAREYKALEITGDEERKVVADLFGRLLRSEACRVGGIVLSPPDKARARRDLLLFAATQLLGDDFDYWEYT